jgi:hypothetical protein
MAVGSDRKLKRLDPPVSQKGGCAKPKGDGSTGMTEASKAKEGGSKETRETSKGKEGGTTEKKESWKGLKMPADVENDGDEGEVSKTIRLYYISN